MSYNAPVKSFLYLLKHAVDVDDVLQLEQHSDVNDDLIGDVLSGAASYSEDILAPLNIVGDQNPAKLMDGAVTTSPGFKEGYQSFVEAGWQGLPVSEASGGMGLPAVISTTTSEMMYSANMAFGLCPMLTASAIKAIEAHGSDELKRLYLQKMVTGEWTGAMDLTEPQSGSDLSALRAKALDNGDGSYSITGQKIFITWGDHDCADNIVHLVLARLPDAPAGSKGISLFLCPKYIANDDGTIGARNAVHVIGLEHKLGIHGSPTCTMEFDKAKGWLVGEVNQGLSCMFTMMNEARLFVGVQGVAIGERAFQAALNFSNERVQGRVVNSSEMLPISSHPDVRRMLLDMKARLMGARALCLATAAASDISNGSLDADERKAAHLREALLTPIAKAYSTDLGVDVSSMAVQVHGGMGFVEETGAAQHYRDSRIAPIYEGTNGVQAIDLVGRKLRRDGGVAMMALISDLRKIIDLSNTVSGDNSPSFTHTTTSLQLGIAAMEQATQIILKSSELDALSVASTYLTLCGHVITSAYLIKATVNGFMAKDELAGSMFALADYCAASLLPKAEADLHIIRRGADPIFQLPLERFSDL